MYAHTFCNLKVESFTGLKDFEIRQTYTVITGVTILKNTGIFMFGYRSPSPTRDTFMIVNTGNDVN